MNQDEVRKGVLAELLRIAPELEEGEVVPAKLLRDQVDLDSMDWLRVIIGVHEKLKVDIPEADYGKLRSLADWAAYLRPKVAA